MQELIKARCVIPIYYSTVTNTAKNYSYKLQELLEEENFIPTINNVGDFDPQELVDYEGTVVLVLATYGNGNSPPDGQNFVDWLADLRAQKKQNPDSKDLSKLSFAILALGNRSFEHFCGNGRTVREDLISLGASQVVEICLCSSNNEEQSIASKFDPWSKSLASRLIQKYQLKQMNKKNLISRFSVNITNEPVENWEVAIKDDDYRKKLGNQFLIFSDMPKAQVLHIKQMREDVSDGRSTLWIRMKIPEGMKLTPACNVSVFPENVRMNKDEQLKGNVVLESSKKNGKLPLPPMSLQQLWRLTNFNQKIDSNLLKYALRSSNESEQIKSQYQKYLKNPENLDKSAVRCKEVYDTLNPGYEFMVDLGLNTLRPYTLASWSEQYMDLVVALDPLGLTSNYYKSMPKQIRICPIQSTFYIPGGRPIIMIANGSGIAPFRSLTEYFIPILQKQKIELYLYFGIQNKKVDYYFREEWEQYQKQGKIKLNIAESRASPDQKVYVQHLIAKDRQFFYDHIFNKKGVIFICGSSGMAKQVESELYESVKLKQKIPFKAFKAYKQLFKNKTIIKEVFE